MKQQNHSNQLKCNIWINRGCIFIILIIIWKYCSFKISGPSNSLGIWSFECFYIYIILYRLVSQQRLLIYSSIHNPFLTHFPSVRSECVRLPWQLLPTSHPGNKSFIQQVWSWTLHVNMKSFGCNHYNKFLFCSFLRNNFCILCMYIYLYCIL